MIKIIDIYSSNSFNSFDLLANGYRGVIFKAGQGAWADVPRYQPDWWQAAKAAGLMRGWYWLVDSRYPSANHLDEMDKFKVFDDLGELGLWADVEKPRISMTETEYWKTPYAGYRNVVDFVYLIRQRGHRIGTYTGPGAFSLIFQGAPQSALTYMAETPLWTAQYPFNYVEGVSKPSLYGKWTDWTLWQWREGPDVNIFNGSDEEFYKFFDGFTGATAPEPTPIPTPQPPEGGTVYTGTVIVTELNIRPTADTSQTSLGKLKQNDVVEASGVVAGWWKLTKITRGGVNVALPAAECYAYEGASKGYIRTEAAPSTGSLPVIHLSADGYPDFVWNPS